MDPASSVSTSGSPATVSLASEELPLPLLSDADEIMIQPISLANMASPDYTKPILQSDSREIKQTLLRSPTAGQQSLLPVPTHRCRSNLPLEQREIIESNLAYQTTTRPSSSWSWEKTEKYVRYKDALMLEYLYDYPIVDWVIEAQDARYAVEAFPAREGMRKLGLSVYAEDMPFSWWMRGEAAPVYDNLPISDEVEAVDDEQEEEVEEVEEVEV
ncbi:hypothetical protein KCU78_g1411, partial [Aureobasidium melanogenum]